MIDAKELRVGLQVAYIPQHVRDYSKGVIWKSLKHPDTQFGFVSSWRTEDNLTKTVFCRFWSKIHPYALRTLSTSEGCDNLDLEVFDSRSLSKMDEILTTLRSDPEEFGWREQGGGS